MKAATETRTAGFTLIELLVSIAIFTFITTLSVMNQSQFNSSVLLTNLAYEIGLSIRQAQVYGITVKQSNTQKFDSGYGIHFNLSDTDGYTTYTLFEDVKPTGGSADHIYTAGTDTILQTFRLQKGNKIKKICVRSDCSNPSHFENRVDISFLRPNPDAYIKAAGNQNYLSFAQICLESPSGAKRKIMVEATGQISVVAEDTSICN